MFGVHRLNINWRDENHCDIQDPETGTEYDVTVRPKERQWTPQGDPVRGRLYVSGVLVTEAEHLGMRKGVAVVKDHMEPLLTRLLNQQVQLSFSSKAGCTCGCSPGFIIRNPVTPFDMWVTVK